MKLSSRKQLLQEADDVLKDISKKKVNEIDWEAYKNSLIYKKGASEKDMDLVNWKLKKELGLIERKYREKNDPVSKQKEIDELIEFVEKLRKHVSEENFKEIPIDSEKQTELQKIIVNTPPFPNNLDFFKDFAKTLVQDPETGMYWSRHHGMPTLPPEWQKDAVEYVMDQDVPYDYSRGWLYNFLRWILNFGSTA
jgi:hypothetical protein